MAHLMHEEAKIRREKIKELMRGSTGKILTKKQATALFDGLPMPEGAAPRPRPIYIPTESLEERNRREADEALAARP